MGLSSEKVKNVEKADTTISMHFILLHDIFSGLLKVIKTWDLKG